ncbi:carbohydrate phosphatase [Amniculicola lignicola CBS 123094]|uniref:Carbohydrate phosphatase n=1 Tax=Amniculicola lignicola CBS 123094 TaxID=1392246 RepID=A0A6A5WTE3_9PLEO|nr:carbohydrate phosphatase [Amniculicola lignicola CBS 123094]
MPKPYADELALAVRIIHSASLLTKSVLRSLKNTIEAETKADDSPVTIADFAAQALIIGALHAVYPSDKFVGEESAAQLRQNDVLAERVWQLVQQAQAAASQTTDMQHVHGHEGSTASPGQEEQERGHVALTFPSSKTAMLDTIDLGTNAELREGRVWVLDPVDGTATFMQGKQYAVCLCLVVDSIQQVGVIGCPNLQYAYDAASTPATRGIVHEDIVDPSGYGIMLTAVRGQGTHIRSMQASSLGDPRPIVHSRSPQDPSTLNFVESALGSTSLVQAEHRAVAESFGTEWPGTVVWSQQLKYVSVALGAADVMLRIPKDRERYTNVWDHAGGHLLVTEAGGIVRDFDGGEIDFGAGRKITGERNWGMVVATTWCFDAVEKAVKLVLDKRSGSA